ncbi:MULTISPECIES: preprotein translocase subunit SecY [Ectothiorhodospira]|uniref:Protein translocase subunit SecY n=1 Tax=Ectothiorhodospira haloalkaliphila TaxID=421628 RepID=W8KIX9_9GAMM|nr:MULTISPECIES: preprotein translocase subunit SecY [Ectothiorhodospira]AHK79724.1 preprotein translocase subunit SecY [Ectothiorhodospira haloalkaliphila]ANB02282.1 preprotein translocase subunit SecY [Ectothiorhodospira sp. BSL-9]MCG5495406.1 preprotein translocase subunit SecY [Ectothiorhodospira variabilis]MCG5498749.1 preprotein translocase subunit SecY [Ectothiorhodospira variabilis]MCG5505004.1 preprotein translocase subunit SecY [Ectothiorhodospira variabilis]
MGKFTELRQRLLFVLMALVVYRIGTFIPVPGIDPVALEQFYDAQSGTILDMFNMFSGGALERLSMFALGVMPYISAAIIMQLLAATVPALQQIKKEGEPGRRKITQYTRYGTVFLALVQSIGISIALNQQTMGDATVALNPGLGFMFTTVVTLVTGTVFLMWLGEQVTERGIGNGISIIIFAGIVAGLPGAFGGTLELASTGELSPAFVMLLVAMALGVIGFIVFIERGQRRITVNYAKRQVGRKVYGGQSSHLPLKLNMAGVIPAIFASSIILFPATLGTWFGQAEGVTWLRDLSSALGPGEPLYVMFYGAAIVFFCFFYTALVFNARETAENLKKSGAFIPGIRPGVQTEKYIDSVMTRLTAVGAIYITAVCLMPEFLILYWNVPFYFGGASMLIIVIVVMDFMAQLQAHLVSHQYEGLMRKANLKGYGKSGMLR